MQLQIFVPHMAKEITHSITSEIRSTTGGNRIAAIRIVDYIGKWESSNSRSIRDHVDAMVSENINEVEVYINSRGGNVFEATEIANELERFKNVKIKVGSLAASAATYLTSKFTTIANANSQFMIHRPKLSANGDIEEIESSLKLLKNITADYKAVYSKKTGKSEEDIELLWAKGDYWMTAQEALDYKFIDAIQAEAELVSKTDVALLEACGAPLIPEIITTKNTLSNMEKNKIISALGLAIDATDEQIETRAAKLKLKAGSYDTLIAEQKGANEKRAKELVDAAVIAKKITAEERDQFEARAIADYDFVKEVLAKMDNTPKLSAALSGKAGGADVKANWTLNDYLENDPQALAQLEENDPEAYKKLEEAYFKSK